MTDLELAREYNAIVAESDEHYGMLYRHGREEGWWDHCHFCNRDWPCDAAKLLIALAGIHHHAEPKPGCRACELLMPAKRN